MTFARTVDESVVDSPRLRRRRTTRPLVLTDVSRFDRLDERALVEAARHDAGAFAALYRRYVDRIHAYALRRSNSRTIAEDVTSATFEKALRALDRYRWREPGIGPWLFRIASNELVDVHRRQDRQDRVALRLERSPGSTVEPPETAPSPSPSGARHDRHRLRQPPLYLQGRETARLCHR